MSPMLTTTELAARWNVNRKTLLEAINDGTIPCTKIGRKWLIPLAWVERREQPPRRIQDAFGALTI